MLLTTPPLALYVHFPWCVRKCPYCDFNSYTLDGRLPEEAYLARLERDLAAQAPQVQGRELVSIFLGGGTPSLFSPPAIARLLQQVRSSYALAADAEVTLEANPGAIERGAFRAYRDAGVTRVSLGAQSFSTAALAALGRIHSPQETRIAAGELHAAGLGNFNLDLMYALPGQDVAGALRDVEEALALAPAHLSHYQLTLEPGTLFAARPPAGIADEDTVAAMLADCAGKMATAGFERYEVSAWARAGRQSRHNANYWTFGDYLGVGAGAHGKLTFPRQGRIVRTTQTREPRRYLAAADAELARRTLDVAELPFEFMLNALRLSGGFSREDFSARTGLPWVQVARPIEVAVRRDMLLETPGGYRPTPLGLAFLNDLLLEFLPEKPPLAAATAPSAGPPGRAMGSIRSF
ncbi:MAG: radical SAM family heme chaperone HemW [Proteobacteria bacterium]|nr:radical SAM family heme chaperone HemW [Pseudomonadota bacterium]